MSESKQHIPVMRAVTILDGPRSNSAGQNTGVMLITDVVGARPPKGYRAYLSPHRDLRLLLRGAKTNKDKQGRFLSETDPVEALFDGGKLLVKEGDGDNDEKIELLDGHPGRGSSFYTYDDIMQMKNVADERTMESFLNSASEEVIDKLKVKLGVKGFSLQPKSEPASGDGKVEAAPRRGRGRKTAA